MGWGAGIGMGEALGNVGKGIEGDLKQMRIQEWKTQEAETARAASRDNAEWEQGKADDRSNREMEFKRTESELNRKSARNVANIRAAKTGGAKLNPYIKAQLDGVDDELKSIYKTQEDGGQVDETRLKQLKSTRMFLLGGGVPGLEAPQAQTGQSLTPPEKPNLPTGSEPSVGGFIKESLGGLLEPDSPTQTQPVETGELDGTTRLPPPQVKALYTESVSAAKNYLYQGADMRDYEEKQEIVARLEELALNAPYSSWKLEAKDLLRKLK